MNPLELSYSQYDNSLMRLFMMNPAQAFSHERIHDWFIDHWQVQLTALKPFERQRFAKRLLASLGRLEKSNIITKNKRTVALNSGRRVEYKYRNPAQKIPVHE